MSDFATARQMALDLMQHAADVTSKHAALDGLDRLALNPNGWFTEPLLKKLTDARVAIIVDRWGDALIMLEDAYRAMEEFIAVVEKSGEVAGELAKSDAIARAKLELGQCAKVQAYVGQRTAQGGE